MARPKDFMKTIFTDYEISNYAQIEKDFTKHGLIVDLARERMENELNELTFSNLQYEIRKLVDLGYLEFDKEYAKEDDGYFPIIFKIIQGYSFNIDKNAKVFNTGNSRGKEVYWDYEVDRIDRIEKQKKKNIHATAIPPMLSYDERKRQ